MKKYLLLLAAFGLFFISSCSDDDDNTDEETTDRIIGTWVLTEVRPEQLFNPDDCPEDSVLTFNSDGTGSGTFYVSENDCAAQSSTGAWENKGNSIYSIEIPISEIGRQDGEVSFSGSSSFTFTPSSLNGLVTLKFEKI